MAKPSARRIGHLSCDTLTGKSGAVYHDVAVDIWGVTCYEAPSFDSPGDFDVDVQDWELVDATLESDPGQFHKRWTDDLKDAIQPLVDDWTYVADDDPADEIDYEEDPDE